MAKEKNKQTKKEETTDKQKQVSEQPTDQTVVEAVVIEEEVIVVEDTANQAATTSTTNSGFGVPDLPTPSKSVLAIVLGTIAALGLFYLGKNYVYSATVNNSPIFRYKMLQTLEKQYGKQALETLIREELIKQEAMKRNVTVSQKEIDAEFKKIDDNLKSQGTTLDNVLKQQNLTKEDVVDQIKMPLLAAKLVENKVTVSDNEVADYIQQNKEMMPQDQNEQQIKASVKDYLRQQKVNQEVEKLVSELRAKANISQSPLYN